MDFKPIVKPVKELYRFSPGFEENAINRIVTIRLFELIAQKAGKSAEDLGFLGCCALSPVDELNPEIWLDFDFYKATYANTSGFSGGAIYYPRKELNALSGYMFLGNVEDNSITTIRNVPVINKKGAIKDVQKDVGILRIKADIIMTMLTVINRSALDPNLMFRYSFNEKGDSYINEFIDPTIMNKPMAIDIAVTTSSAAYFNEPYDPDRYVQVLHEKDNKLRLTYVGERPKEIEKRMNRRRKEETTKESREPKESAKPQKKFGGRGGA